MKRWSKISSVVAILAVILILYFTSSLGFYHSKDVVFAQSSSLTIISLSDNKLVGGGQFVISPNPFTGTGNYTIKDNSSDDTEKDKDGVIILSGIKNGNYNIIQTSTIPGYGVDQIQKIIQVNNSSGVATFTDLPTNNASISSTSPRSVTYTTKFECGSIFAGEGPLRPGHYDTDISLFNKQRFQTQVFWNSVPNNGPSSNAILLKMNSETSKSITCQDIRTAFGNNNENFIEGFTIINVPLDSTFGSEVTMTNPSSNNINMLDVQAFYTANALDTLPHEVIVDKISFNIIQDGSGKIPLNMMQKTLDMSIPSGLNQISDTEKKVKDVLAKQYTLSDDDLTKIVINIKDVSIGVGVLIDDHAISLSTVMPQVNP